jgi:hypothetical protein
MDVMEGGHLLLLVVYYAYFCMHIATIAVLLRPFYIFIVLNPFT